MKHLKLFETWVNPNIGEYYESIDDLEYGYACTNNTIPITTGTFKKIESNLPKEYKISRSPGSIVINDGTYYNYYKVYQGSDDWFYVSKKVQDIMSGPYNDSYNYYKCDQIDGLLKFIEDRIGFKTNESIQENDLWTEIEYDEYSTITQPNINFNKNYFDIISKRLIGDWYCDIKKTDRGDELNSTGINFLHCASPSNVIDIDIWQDEDEWFFIELTDDTDNQLYYKCDSFNGLLNWLTYQGVINESSLNESLADDQIEELSDLFVDVSDKFGLNEANQDNNLGSRLSDNGAWRITRMSDTYTELFVQINVDQVDDFEFEDSLEEFLSKVKKLGYKIRRDWWRDKFKYPYSYDACRYMIKIYQKT
jgi:hypothetical protein